MMCYPPTGYIMFSLKKLNFYGARGPDKSNTVLNVLNNKVKNGLFTDVKMNFFIIECFF